MRASNFYGVICKKMQILQIGDDEREFHREIDYGVGLGQSEHLKVSLETLYARLNHFVNAEIPLPQNLPIFLCCLRCIENA